MSAEQVFYFFLPRLIGAAQAGEFLLGNSVLDKMIGNRDVEGDDHLLHVHSCKNL